MSNAPINCGNEHERIQAMLPWYINGTLDDGDHREVRSHLEHCVECRKEAQLHVQVARQVRRGARVQPAPQTSLEVLMQRIDAHEAARERWQRWLGWLPAVRGGTLLQHTAWAQAVTILLLVVVLAWLVTHPEPPADYRTLGAPVDAITDGGSHLQLVLDGSLTVVQVQDLLQKIGGRIVFGPTAHGVYVIALGVDRSDERSPAEVAAWLSTQPGVVVAAVLSVENRP